MYYFQIAKASSTSSPTTEELPSSNEYQNSDNLTDYSSLPVSPLLINCEESVSNILKGLTSPAWYLYPVFLKPYYITFIKNYIQIKCIHYIS